MLFLGMVLIPIMLSDIIRYRVPNICIVGGWILGAVNQLLLPDQSAYLSWGLGVALPIVMLYPLFRLRMIGAGDIKLLSVVGGYLGAHRGFQVFVVALVLGAVISVIRMLRHHMLFHRVQFLAQYISESFITKNALPYYDATKQGRTVVVPLAAIIAFCAAFANWV